MSRPDRHNQCDDTCTADCGACKGLGRPESPVDEIVQLSAEMGLYGDLGTLRPAEPTVEGRLAELDALRAALARVEALATQWETSDVRLSRRIAANELRRAMEGSDG